MTGASHSIDAYLQFSVPCVIWSASLPCDLQIPSQVPPGCTFAFAQIFKWLFRLLYVPTLNVVLIVVRDTSLATFEDSVFTMGRHDSSVWKPYNSQGWAKMEQLVFALVLFYNMGLLILCPTTLIYPGLRLSRNGPITWHSVIDISYFRISFSKAVTYQVARVVLSLVSNNLEVYVNKPVSWSAITEQHCIIS